LKHHLEHQHRPRARRIFDTRDEARQYADGWVRSGWRQPQNHRIEVQYREPCGQQLTCQAAPLISERSGFRLSARRRRPGGLNRPSPEPNTLPTYESRPKRSFPCCVGTATSEVESSARCAGPATTGRACVTCTVHEQVRAPRRQRLQRPRRAAGADHRPARHAGEGRRLEMRAALRQQLWHPDDARLEPALPTSTTSAATPECCSKWVEKKRKLPQRRKDAKSRKRNWVNSIPFAALCVFAPLREAFFLCC